MHAIRTIAGLELRIQARSRWTASFALIFAALAVAISYFGLVTAGSVGIQSFERTAASLLNLVLYLAPIVALTMSTLSLSGERGAQELLFSQPISRSSVLIGKLAGLFVSLGTATLAGFGLSGLLIATAAGTDGLLRFLAMVGVSLLLEAVFLALGCLVAVAAATRVRAFGAALFFWFFFVLFYDLVVIGMSFLLRERLANQMILWSLFGNPVDLARVSALLAMGDPAIFGAAGAALVKAFGGAAASHALLLAGLCAWVALPVLAANRWLRHRDV
ncbi:MAG: ABC transporter permease [Bryobacteraceae bacterium]